MIYGNEPTIVMMSYTAYKLRLEYHIFCGFSVIGKMPKLGTKEICAVWKNLELPESCDEYECYTLYILSSKIF